MPIQSPDPLLVTKLCGPRLPAQFTPRSRLTSQLDAAIESGRPLTLISAPAGFGKTSLLGEWLLTREWHISHTAWLSLDESDNDANRFWAYFIAALQMLKEDLGKSAQAVLQARGPLALPDESFLTVLLNEIAAIPEPVVLVLDDYHLMNIPVIHSGLSFLIDHLPAQMHLILASRSDPPLPLARWRAGSQLTEIRTEDLRFTQEEVASLLVESLGFRLSNTEVHALVDRTEGWIAGLQLAALSMRDRLEISAFIADFTGSHQYVFDYLSEEILQRQSETIRLFLLHTSILDHFCAPLCEVVTGQSDCQAMLEHLERANLFLRQLDNKREWYRYHHLFADVLRQQLRKTQPALISELHMRASQWFAQYGLAAEAIQHALAGKDFEGAAVLVEANATNIHWQRGDNATLFTWLQALPDGVIRSRPRLCLSHAWALLISGQSAAAQSRMEDLEKLMVEAPESVMEIQEVRAQLATIRASLARSHNDLPQAIKLCRQALQYASSTKVSLRAAISLNLGTAYWQDGNISAASQVLADMSTIDEQGNILLTALAAQAFRADLLAEQGHLHQAARINQQTIQMSMLDHGMLSPVAALAQLGIGNLLLEWNDLHAAGRYIEKGLELAELFGNVDGMAWAFLYRAKWEAALGALEEADQALSRAEQIVQKFQVTPLTGSRVAGYRGKLWILQEKMTEAMLWAKERGLETENEVSYQHLPEYLSFARLLLMQSRFTEMNGLLERMLRLTESSDLTGRVIEILLLRAIAFLAQGKKRGGEESLERALILAQPEGYVRLFVDEGERMKILLQKYLQRHASKSDRSSYTYATDLLANLTHQEDVPSSIQSSTSGSGALVGLLSQRELQILRLLAEGLSNREIAQQSYISVGTVKVHLKHIYSKLEVGNRTEAANRARQLSLI